MNFREWINAHPLVSGAGAALLAACLAEAGALALASSARAASASQAANLKKYEALGAQIAAARGEAAKIVVAPPGAFTAEAVGRAAQQEKVELAERTGSSSPYDARTVEQVVKVRLTAVAREPLARFLQACERIDPAVRTTKLLLTLNTKSPGLVDATVELSAYERKTPN